MKTAAASFVAAWLATAGVVAQDPTVVTFDGDSVGGPPSGFVLAAMRQPDPGRWRVHEEDTEQYLIHDADPSAKGYALAVRTGAVPGDLVVSVRLQLVGGSRAGGIVWHYVDERNYYATLLDLSRGQLSMYRVADGHRIRMEFEDDLDLNADEWHTMQVVHSGNQTQVSLGGIRVFRDRDRRHDRSTGAGRVGLIATGGAEVRYDDLRIDQLKRSP